ncbi:ABC transporter permease [Methylosinus sp. Sm6]|uniref:ABC transporter permease n=1 Tax=Methylosinus sp. Sm6 TaxID=2866948 RepID=UPI00351D296E
MMREQSFSLRRVGAMTLRYSYLLRSSYPRMLEMMYWPLVQMLTWGFLQAYLIGRPGGLAGADATAIGAGSLIGAVLLWDILLRGQQGFSFSFLEELWARNIPNLFMSPLRPTEFVVSMMTMSLMRLVVGMVPVTLLAIWFFGFNLWALGLAFGAFFAILILFAWSVGLFVAGLLLRYGLGAENLVWSLMFVIQPLGCVYYPVAVLPAWVQPISWALPPTYVFEGLRSVLIDHALRADLMAMGLALDAVLFALAWWSFSRLLESAREAGSLLQTGE